MGARGDGGGDTAGDVTTGRGRGRPAPAPAVRDGDTARTPPPVDNPGAAARPVDNSGGRRSLGLRSDRERNQSRSRSPRPHRPAHHQPPRRPRSALLARLAGTALRRPSAVRGRRPSAAAVSARGRDTSRRGRPDRRGTDRRLRRRPHSRGRGDRRGRARAHRRPRPPRRQRPCVHAGSGTAPRLLRPARRPPPRPRPGHGPHPRRVPVVLPADPQGPGEVRH